MGGFVQKDAIESNDDGVNLLSNAEFTSSYTGKLNVTVYHPTLNVSIVLNLKSV